MTLENYRIEELVKHYFQLLFSTEHLSHHEEAPKCIQPWVIDDMNPMLCAEYAQEENLRSRKQMNLGKALRPNGPNPFFFQKFGGYCCQGCI